MTLFSGDGIALDPCNAIGAVGWFSIKADSVVDGAPVEDGKDYTVLEADSAGVTDPMSAFSEDSQSPCVSGMLAQVTGAGGEECNPAGLDCEWDAHWGGGIQLTLNQAEPGGTSQPFDAVAAGMTGVRFRVSGDTGDVPVRLSVFQDGEEFCTGITLGQDEWVRFSDLKHMCWGEDGTQALDLSRIEALYWGMVPDAGSSHSVSNFCVESVVADDSVVADNRPGEDPSAAGCLAEVPLHSNGGTVAGSGDAARYAQYNLTRNGRNYRFMANGWGPKWESHSISYGGSRFTVNELLGQQGSNYEPAGIPTVFCGAYADSASKDCGLPAPLDELTELDTGLRWSPAETGTTYNVAYDIWLGNGGSFAGYLMIWLRDPPGGQPAGSIKASKVTVGSVEEAWDVWTGTVNGYPIVNYVRPQGSDLTSLSFDALEFVSHAEDAYALPGDTVLSVAVGTEIWNGPLTDLKIEDFCVVPR